MAEFEIEFLPNGQVRVGRSVQECNSVIYELICKLNGNDQDEELKKFFDQAEETKILFGKERLCG